MGTNTTSKPTVLSRIIGLVCGLLVLTILVNVARAYHPYVWALWVQTYPEVLTENPPKLEIIANLAVVFEFMVFCWLSLKAYKAVTVPNKVATINDEQSRPKDNEWTD